MAENSKVVALRVNQERYDQILLECAERKINKTEWIETQLAIAANYSSKMAEIESDLLKILKIHEDHPEWVPRRVKALLRKVSGR
jgi:hypothetical protein